MSPKKGGYGATRDRGLLEQVHVQWDLASKEKLGYTPTISNNSQKQPNTDSVVFLCNGSLSPILSPVPATRPTDPWQGGHSWVQPTHGSRPKPKTKATRKVSHYSGSSSGGSSSMSEDRMQSPPLSRSSDEVGKKRKTQKEACAAHSAKQALAVKKLLEDNHKLEWLRAIQESEDNRLAWFTKIKHTSPALFEYLWPDCTDLHDAGSHLWQSPYVSPIQNSSQARGGEVRQCLSYQFCKVRYGLNARRHVTNVSEIVKVALSVPLMDVP